MGAGRRESWHARVRCSLHHDYVGPGLVFKHVDTQRAKLETGCDVINRGPH